MARGRHSAPRRVHVGGRSIVIAVAVLVWVAFGVWGFMSGDVTWWLWAAWLEIGVIAIVALVLYGERFRTRSGVQTRRSGHEL